MPEAEFSMIAKPAADADDDSIKELKTNKEQEERRKREWDRNLCILFSFGGELKDVLEGVSYRYLIAYKIPHVELVG